MLVADSGQDKNKGHWIMLDKKMLHNQMLTKSGRAGGNSRGA